MDEHSLEKRRAGQRQLAVRVLAMPADTNSVGDIFGGWLMSQMDIGGSIVAWQVAGGQVVTVAVNKMQFYKPVLVGDLVSCYAEVSSVGRTSITVDVEVYTEREPDPESVHFVAAASITYVAVDTEGQPKPVGKTD